MKTRKHVKLLGAAVAALAALPLCLIIAQEAGMVELELELPRPMFTGTPKNIRTPNLEPPRQGPRPAFYLPEGCTNVAFEKPVTGSDTEPVIGDLDLVTDGDKEGVEGSYVELAPGKQYVQIDLEAQYEIHAIVLWHYHCQARVYRDVVVRTANDPDFILDVETVYNNDHDNSIGLGVGEDFEYIEQYIGRIMPVDGVKARYVRLYSNGSTADELNHYTEVEVYGRPVN